MVTTILQVTIPLAYIFFGMGRDTPIVTPAASVK